MTVTGELPLARMSLRDKRSILCRLTGAFATIVVFLSLTLPSADAAGASGSSVLIIDIDSSIDPVSAGKIKLGIDNAEDSNASMLVIRLDTPGGLNRSMREIVRYMVESDVPIAVFVSPAGARASSAGTFVTAAAHFAVMTPGTYIGAASVVDAGGKDLPDTMARKLNEADRAFIRSIAQLRGRNHTPLENAVVHTNAYSAQEALQLGIIDLLAVDLPSMLQQLHGRTAVTREGPKVVDTADANVEFQDTSLIGHIVGLLANTNLVFILLVIGGFAILIELAAPGVFGPGLSGALGVILIVLAFIGFVNLPGNWIGLLLILLAMGLFYGETTAPGLGLFGIGGVVSLILGAVFLFGNLFDPSSIPEIPYTVSPVTIGITSFLALSLWILFLRLVVSGGGTSSGFQTQKQASIEGAIGVAISTLEPSGKVRVSGQEWSASTSPDVSIKEGDEIRVIAVYGDVLKVERIDPER
ncbi:MAG: nodulation protein NfeD [Chloroflexota bacterium]|nr:nodulation protein NfeD [Chloroflexota bacterium]